MKTLIRNTLLLSALTGFSTTAQARWPNIPEGQLTSAMCMLKADGTGQYQISLDSYVVAVLTAALPDLFSLVEEQERCDDGKDNNCDGQIDEGCSQVTNIWDAGQDCDACMAERCSVVADECQGDKGCEDAVACVLEAKCLDASLGPISCFCGEDVGIEECQATAINDLDGACMAEFARNIVPSWIPAPETGSVLAGKIFLCMTRQCADQCAENIYNHEDPAS